MSGAGVSHEYRKWIQQSRVNYFSCYLQLWIGFNGWFVKKTEKNKDREAIKKIKEADLSNVLYARFDSLLEDKSDKEAELFKSYLEALYFSLNRASIFYPQAKGNTAPAQKISFNSALIDKNSCVDLKYNAFSEEDFCHEDYDENDEFDNFIELDTVKLKKEPEQIYRFLIEALYLIRNELVHGYLDPGNDEHREIVKYSFEILSLLTKDL